MRPPFRGSSEPPVSSEDSSEDVHELSGLRRLRVPFKIAGVNMGSQDSINSAGMDEHQQEDFMQVAKNLRRNRKACQRHGSDAFATPFGNANVVNDNFLAMSTTRTSRRRRRASSVSNIAAKFENLIKRSEEEEERSRSRSMGSSSSADGRERCVSEPKHVRVKIKLKRRVSRRGRSGSVASLASTGADDSMMDLSEEIARAFQNDDDGMVTGDDDGEAEDAMLFDGASHSEAHVAPADMASHQEKTGGDCMNGFDERTGDDVIEVNPEDVRYHYKPWWKDNVEEATHSEVEVETVLNANKTLDLGHDLGLFPAPAVEEEEEEEEGSCPAFDALFVRTVEEDETGYEEESQVANENTREIRKGINDTANDDTLIGNYTWETRAVPETEHSSGKFEEDYVVDRPSSQISAHSDETFVTCFQEQQPDDVSNQEEGTSGEPNDEAPTSCDLVLGTPNSGDHGNEESTPEPEREVEMNGNADLDEAEENGFFVVRKIKEEEGVQEKKDARESKRQRNRTIDLHDLKSASSTCWSWNGQVARYVQKSYSPSLAAAAGTAAAAADAAGGEHLEEGVGHGLGIILDRLRSIETKLDEIKTMDQSIFCPELEPPTTANIRSIDQVLPKVGETPTRVEKEEEEEEPEDFKAVGDDLPPAPSTSPSFDGDKDDDEEETATLTDDDEEEEADEESETASSHTANAAPPLNVAVSLPDSEDEGAAEEEGEEVKYEILTEEQRMARIEEIAKKIMLEKQVLAKHQQVIAEAADKGLETLSERSDEEEGEGEGRQRSSRPRLSRRTRSASRDRASSLAKIRYCWRCHRTGHESFDCRKEIKPGNWCPRCLESGHWENECWVNDKQVVCTLCALPGHLPCVHETTDFRQRKLAVDTFGWLAFKDWFKEPDFWSWWNVRGCTSVPLYKLMQQQHL